MLTLISNEEFESFAKRPLLPNFCVRLNILLAEKLKLYPQNTLCIPVVKIFAYLELEQN